MDPDSLDWIWEDFDNPSSDPAEVQAFFDGVDDDDDADENCLRVGLDGYETDGSSDSDVNCSLLVRDRKAAQQAYAIIDDVKRRYGRADGPYPKMTTADDRRPGDDESEDDDEGGGDDESEDDDEDESDDEGKGDDDGEESTRDMSYVDAQKAAATQLSEVQLVWADTLHKCTVNEKNVPDSYVKTTNMEKLIMFHAKNFKEQFEVKYPNRRQLALVLKNECAIQKCICTFIKPSRLVYNDINNVLSYSEFVANHITYTKLNDPKIVPPKIVSPAMTLETQSANCFELATLLASFLIGCGYNAFVVQGYATEDVCNNDLRKVKIDVPPKFKNERKFRTEDSEVLDDEYAIQPLNNMYSEFVQFLIEEEKKKNVVQNDAKENNSMNTSDPLYGQRVHSWVAIIPMKPEDEHPDRNPYFIEPSTGERKEISDENYIGIEAIWNHKNYWVNIQPLDAGCAKYNFNLMDATCWECFLPPTDSSHDENDSPRHVVVMPDSWVNVLEVPRNKYIMLYPAGKKIVSYVNALKESYGDYIMPDGLIAKTTFYKEPDYVYKMFVKKVYKHRIDKLIGVEISISDDETETTECFHSGRNDCLKTHVFYGDGKSIRTKRLITFYDLRFDSMVEIEIDENSFSALFNDRSDFLFWRSCIFQPKTMENNINKYYVQIKGEYAKRKPLKIIEKYLRDETKHKDRDIATRTFDFFSHTIFVQYQYGEGQITQSSRLFRKPMISHKGKFYPESVTENIVYPYVGHLKSHEAYLLSKDMMKAEDEAYREVSKLEDVVHQILETRGQELSEFKLEINSRDRDWSHEIRKLLGIKKDTKLAEHDTEKQIDYALPFFQVTKKPLTHKTALKLREQVINDFRQSTKYDFTRAHNLFTKKQSELKSATKALEENDFKDLEVKQQTIMLCSTLKDDMEFLELKMQIHRKRRVERYNRLASYLNNDCPEFKMLPPLKLVDSRSV